MEAGIPAHRGPWLQQAHSSHCSAEKREEEVQAKPSVQASAAVSQPSGIRFRNIEVSRGSGLLYGQVSAPNLP